MNTHQSAKQVVTFKINGVDVAAVEDQSIREVASEHGFHIPTLCHLDGVRDVAACRLCLVEIKGSSRLFPACVTRCREGIEVTTDSERLTKYRRTLVELFFSEGNHICSICEMNGHCELQSLAESLHIDHIRIPYRYPQRSIDASHPRFVLDRNRCVLCTRCVRVCDQIEGMHNWDVMGRGINAKVVADFDKPWGISDWCTSCGKCVVACPTGAIYDKNRSGAELAKDREVKLGLPKQRSR